MLLCSALGLALSQTPLVVGLNLGLKEVSGGMQACP